LSIPGESAASRLVHGTKPYKRADGQIIATDWTYLIDGTIDFPLLISERGDSVNAAVWTGTKENGDAYAQTCAGWSDATSAMTGGYGSTYSTDFSWTKIISAQGCDQLLHIYCFEE
jgi:hypothetical protein